MPVMLPTKGNKQQLPWEKEVGMWKVCQKECTADNSELTAEMGRTTQVMLHGNCLSLF